VILKKGGIDSVWVSIVFQKVKGESMFDQPYLTEEHRMVADLYRDFVDKEIMPVRQKIDDDKDHTLIKKILQAMTDIGRQKAPFPTEYGGMDMTSTLSAAIMHEELGRGDSGIGTAATVTAWTFFSRSYWRKTKRCCTGSRPSFADRN
jgi:alkylation response protein AidB-like acyl-CoA dehydrogenase